MDYRKLFLAEPGKRVKLSKIDPGYHRKHLTEARPRLETEKHRETISAQQDLMYSEARHSLLIVLAGHGRRRQRRHRAPRHEHHESHRHRRSPRSSSPSAEDLKHDFLWRVHPHTPGQGHGVHLQPLALRRRSGGARAQPGAQGHLVEALLGHQRFREAASRQNSTRIIKFFLYISPEEQLKRFADRLRGSRPQLEDQRRRLPRARVLGRLREGLRGRLLQDQHRERALVHHPCQSQVVSQPGHFADRRLHLSRTWGSRRRSRRSIWS